MFSTVQKDLSPDLFEDLMRLDKSSMGKRMVYLAQLGVLLDGAMRKNSGRLNSLVFNKAHGYENHGSERAKEEQSAPLVTPDIPVESDSLNPKDEVQIENGGDVNLALDVLRSLKI